MYKMIIVEIDTDSVPFGVFDEEEAEEVCNQLILLTQMVYQFQERDTDV